MLLLGNVLACRLFLFFVCVPTDLCDVRLVTKLLQRLVTRLAHTVVCLGFLLVPLWILMLWLLAVGWTWEQMLSMLPSFEQLKAAAADWQGTSAAFSSWASSVAGGGWRLALSGSLPDLSTPEQVGSLHCACISFMHSRHGIASAGLVHP